MHLWGSCIPPQGSPARTNPNRSPRRCRVENVRTSSSLIPGSARPKRRPDCDRLFSLLASSSFCSEMPLVSNLSAVSAPAFGHS